MLKKSKKILVLVALCTTLIGSVAYAKSFVYDSKSIKYFLDVSWSWSGNDVAEADTRPESGQMQNGRKVATYLEATQNNASTVVETDFDHGYWYSNTNIPLPDVYRFNSTHGVVPENNVYDWLKFEQETDW